MPKSAPKHWTTPVSARARFSGAKKLANRQKKKPVEALHLLMICDYTSVNAPRPLLRKLSRSCRANSCCWASASRVEQTTPADNIAARPCWGFVNSWRRVRLGERCRIHKQSSNRETEIQTYRLFFEVCKKTYFYSCDDQIWNKALSNLWQSQRNTKHQTLPWRRWVITKKSGFTLIPTPGPGFFMWLYC